MAIKEADDHTIPKMKPHQNILDRSSRDNNKNYFIPGKLKLQNRKQLSQADIKKLSLYQKSRYLAYEYPPWSVVQAQLKSMKRVKEKSKISQQNPMTKAEQLEKEKYSKIIGELKAAEARGRQRIMRLKYEANKAQEINQMVAYQSTALKAVRLEALLPAYPSKITVKNPLNKLEKDQLERLLEDSTGISISRIP